VREEDGIVQQDLMALVTVDFAAPFAVPGTTVEDSIADLAAPIRGAAEKPLRNVMMLRRVRASLDRRSRIAASTV
jgi:hypothetical protein